MRWRLMAEWRYSSIFLDLGTKCKWVIIFTPRPFYPLRNRPYSITHWVVGWVGPTAFMSHCFDISKKSEGDSYLCNVQNKQNVKSPAQYIDPCLRVLSCTGSNPITTKCLHCLITRKTRRQEVRHRMNSCSNRDLLSHSTYYYTAGCFLSTAVFMGAGLWV